jgi:hypothetical protein
MPLSRRRQILLLGFAGKAAGGILIQVAGGNGSNFQIVPGPGLAKLRAVNSVEVQASQPTWANTDLAFLSSLTCVGFISGPTMLTSLAGLGNVVDGVADSSSGNIVFYFLDNPNLTNVSALSAYARCGRTTQRPDGFQVPQPAVKVQGCTDVLAAWATLCNYALYGVCPGTPIPPQSPPRLSPPPPLRAPPPMWK